MSTKKMGGPAFPHLRRRINENTYEPIAEGGMTLWDYYAAAAISGATTAGLSSGNVAEYVVKVADAMLAERERRMKP